ncbi:MAG: magnesium transporter [Bacillota bacterium]|nr:magnesium transporter [Bacillota bacterium]
MDRDILKLVSEIKELLGPDKTHQLRTYLARLHPSDLAEVVEEFEPDIGARLLALIDEENAADVLDEMDLESQRDVIASLSTPQIAGILEEMPDDDLADLFGDLSREEAQRLLGLMDREDAHDVRQLLRYPEDTAGGRMTADFVWVSENSTAAQAIDRIRRLAPEAETINYIYVLDGGRRLKGVLSLREIIVANPDSPVRSFMERDVVTVNVTDDQEEVARTAMHYDLLAVPVVDAEGRMLGISTIDDLVDVLDEEATEDLHGVLGGGHGPGVQPGVAAGAWARVRLRLPWLVILMFGDFLAANVIRGFAHVLEAIVALAFFIPVLMDMGGNVGTQSLAMTVRGLATGEIEHSDLPRILWRETKIGVMLGLFCGLLIAGVATLWQGNPTLGLVIGISMVATMTIAAVLGTMVPIVFDRMGVDSAVASSPFITSAVDVSGLLIYFATARWLLSALKT